RLLEQARDAIYQASRQSFLAKAARNLAFDNLFPHQDRMIAMTSLVGLYQRSGLQRAAHRTKMINLIPEHVRTMEKVLPNVPKRNEMKQRPHVLDSVAPRKKKVAFFSGCLMDTVFMKTNDATMKLLQYAGCDIVIPLDQGCCGALHGHSGEANKAKALAKKNIENFEKEEVDCIITNAGGCGAFLQDYRYLFKDEPDWQERAAAFAHKIKDISTVLIKLEFDKNVLKLDDATITYQDSCHLKNGQKTFMEPRQLLQAIEGINYKEMEDAGICCGSAGIYNIIEREMSMQILDHKMEQAKNTHAKIIVTSNPGCLL